MKNIDFDFELGMCICNLVLIILLIINLNLTNSVADSMEELTKISENQQVVITEQQKLIDEIDWKKYKKQLRKETIKSIEKKMGVQ